MAEKIENEFGFNASDAISQIAAVDAALAKLETRLNSFATTASKAGAAGVSFKKTGDTGAAAFDKLGASARRGGNQVMGVFDRLISANGQFTTSLAVLSRIVFTQAVVRGFRAITSSISEGLSAAIRLGTAVAQIQTISNNKLGSDANIGDQLRGISGKFNFELDDTALATYNTISNQVVDTAESFRFMEKAAILARAGVSTLDEGVGLLSATLNTLDRDLSDADQIISQFFKATELGVFTIKQLSAELPKVLPLAKQLGVGLDEVLAAFVALTQRGTTPAQASTQLRGLFLGLIKPSSDLKKVYDDLGIATAEQGIQTDRLVPFLQKLLATTDGTTGATGELFRNQRALLGVLQTAQQGADDYADALRAVQNVQSDLAAQKAEDVLNSDAQTIERDMQIIRNAWEKTGETIIHVAANNLRVLGGVKEALFDQGAVDTTALDGLGVSLTDFTNRLAQINDNRAVDAARALSTAQQISRAEVNLAKQTQDQIIATATGGLNRLEQLGRQNLDRIQKQIRTAQNIIRDAPGRIADIQARGNDIAFRGRISGLPEAQKSLALQQQADQLASSATDQLLQAVRIGDQAGLERARTAFNTAISTGQEAQNVAEAAGAYDRAGQAAQRLQGIIQSQIGAERQAADEAKKRLPILETQARQEAEKLVNIQKAAKEFTKNLGVLDAQGNKLDPDELARRQEAQVAALNRLLEAGVTKEQLIPLVFQATEGLNEVKAQADEIFSKVKLQFEVDTGLSVRNLESALERQFKTPADLTSGITDATKELNELIKVRSESLKIDERIGAVQTAILDRIRASANSKQLLAEFPELEKLDKLSFGSLDALIEKLSRRVNPALIQDLRTIQELAVDRINTPRADDDRINLLQELLQADPAFRFTDAASKIETSAGAIAASFKGAADSAAASALKAAEAAERANRAASGGGGGQGLAKGGLVRYFANGGLARGTDTIPAMLTEGEFVMPADKTSQFFSELTAMRAGIPPSSSQSVSNTGIAGDVVINVHGARGPDQTAEAIEARLKRAKRRGTI